MSTSILPGICSYFQRSVSNLKEQNMMANQSGGNNHGQRTARSRRVLQFASAMAFSIWLLFQINHEFNNQRHHQSEENISVQDSGTLLLGRKVNLGFRAGGLVRYSEEHSSGGGDDIAGNSEKTEKLMREAKEGLIGEESVGFALIVETTGDGGSVTYEGNVFEDENGVPPDVSGVYLMRSEDGGRNASAGLGTL